MWGVKAAPRILLVLLLVVLAAPPARAIEGAVHVGHSGDIRALQLVDDTLWIGTSGGVLRYDLGNDRFSGRVTLGERLPSNSVRVIRARGDEVLVGTDAGLAVFDGASTRVYTNHSHGVHDSVSFDLIRSIDFGRDDVVFVGTHGDGLGVMTPEGGHSITREDSLLDDKVYGVVETWATDEFGVEAPTYYYATSMGLCAFGDSLWTNFQAGAGIPRGEIRRLLWRDGLFYLLVGVGGVYRFDGHRAVSVSPRDVLPADDVADIALGPGDVIWAVGRLGGIAVFQNDRWKRIGQGDPMIDNARWRCAHTDGSDAYFGSADGLIVTMRDNILRKLRIPGELPSGAVRSIVGVERNVFFLSGPEVVRVSRSLSDLKRDDSPPGVVAMAADGNGSIWVAGRWGIYRRTDDGYNDFVQDIVEVEPAFTTLCFDANGWLWTATRSGNVYRYDGDLWLPMGESGEVLGGAVEKLCAERGAVWAAARSGVARFDGRAWNVVAADSLGGEVRDLVVAPGEGGGVVVATTKRLWRSPPAGGDWQPLGVLTGRLAPASPDSVFVAPRGRTINCAAFDDEGNLYLGTDAGLALLGEGRTRWIGAADGLGGEAVVDLFLENGEALWVGFRSDGLTRIPLRSLW